MILCTPRSKNSLWVAAEAGAAWALKKELVAALLYVVLHHENRVVGFYDFGTGHRKVGVYDGTFDHGVWTYNWKWLEQPICGSGQMVLSKDGHTLHGEWWYEEQPERVQHVGYRWTDDHMPSWISRDDFEAMWPGKR